MNNFRGSLQTLQIRELDQLTLQEIELAMWFLENSTIQTPIPKPLKNLQEKDWIAVQVLLEELMGQRSIAVLH